MVIQYRRSVKKAVPQARPWSAAARGADRAATTSRGASAGKAIQPRSAGGNARERRTPDRTDRRSPVARGASAPFMQQPEDLLHVDPGLRRRPDGFPEQPAPPV